MESTIGETGGFGLVGSTDQEVSDEEIDAGALVNSLGDRMECSE